MQTADRRVRPSDTLPSTDICETLGHAAILNDRAIVVGNRAGIVEWANPAWSRMTGFPLSETIYKPITDFLEQAAVELELVDFVAQNFLDGRPSTIEFPFETFDDRSIWVHLEVQPIRGAEGDVSEFVATATDVSERHRQDISGPEPKRRSDRGADPRRPAHPIALVNETRLSLSAETEIVCEQTLGIAGARTYFDIVLDRHLPSISSNHLLLREIVRLLLEAAILEVDEVWGFVTVMTGRTESSRSHASAVHPIPVRAPQLAEGPMAYLEVHDTAPTLADEALDAIREGAHSNDPRVNALARAAAMATAISASLLVDSTPGCGTQALLLLPLR
jgi:PAS domain S-box-containing protein